MLIYFSLEILVVSDAIAKAALPMFFIGVCAICDFRTALAKLVFIWVIYAASWNTYGELSVTSIAVILPLSYITLETRITIS